MITATEFRGSVALPSPDDAIGWHSYFCGHCGRDVSGLVPAYVSHPDGRSTRWLLCSSCGEGSVRTADGTVYPGVPFGPNIEGLPDDVLGAYQEARRCMMVSAYTACELICRKILMHVAVDKRAKEGESFAKYLAHLESEGYITPPMKQWTKLIKDHGNESTHELASPDETRAQSTLMFTAELLRLVYEMEYLAALYTPRTASP